MSSEYEQTCTNSQPLVEDTPAPGPAENLLAAGGATSGRFWATPPLRLGLSRRNSGKFRKTPETLSEFFLEFPSSTAGIPQALCFKAFEASRAFPELPPPQYGWGRLFFQKWASQSCSWNSQRTEGIREVWGPLSMGSWKDLAKQAWVNRPHLIYLNMIVGLGPGCLRGK